MTESGENMTEIYATNISSASRNETITASTTRYAEIKYAMETAAMQTMPFHRMRGRSFTVR
jgi:hypothetical protein